MDLFEDEETAEKAVRFLDLPLDCTWLDEEAMDRVVTKVRVDDGNLKIIDLDEIHRLSRRFLDVRLLKPLEDCEAIWIASSTYVRKQDDDEGRKRLELEKMFQNRFTDRIETQKPTSAELALWLAERCEEWVSRSRPQRTHTANSPSGVARCQDWLSKSCTRPQTPEQNSHPEQGRRTSVRLRRVGSIQWASCGYKTAPGQHLG